MPHKARPVQTASEDEENRRRLRIEELGRIQLARRLHDGPIQAVAALALRAHLVKRKLVSEPRDAGKEVQELEALARRTTQDLRYLQFMLVPHSLESSGLPEALQDLVRHLDDLYGLTVHLTLDAQAADALSVSQQHLLFHIAADALDNARTHSQASGVSLKLNRPETGVVIFEVEDDGLGFDPKATETAGEQASKFGLAILRERVQLLNGELHIRSAAGSGSLLRVTIPVGPDRR